MSDIYVRKKNDLYLEIETDEAIQRELSEYFCFYADNYQFSPAYKQKRWDGKIRIFNRRNNTIYAGLLYHLCQFADEEEYSIHIDESVDIPDPKPSLESGQFFFDKYLNVHSGGKKITPRDPQMEAFRYALAAKRCVIEAATASGKSLIIYALVRYWLKMLPDNKKVLIIVPSINLVNQMYNDFDDYSSEDEWNAEENCHKIYQGQEKDVKDKRVIISTYHSLADLPKKYFNKFDVVVGDEAHFYQSKTLKKLMYKLTDCPYRFGFTGTLQHGECHRWVIEGLFGKAVEIVNAKEMIKMGDAPPLDIKAVILKYPDDQRKYLYNEKNKDENKKRKYHVEVEYILESQKRKEFLLELAKQIEGNSLFLFERIEQQGLPLYEFFKEHCDKNIYMVYGKTEGYEREEIRRIVEKEKDAIIVASYGVFSTGVSIKNLHNLVFASSPGKKRNRVVQSIGRILRKHETKDQVYVYDIVDDLSYNEKSNFMVDHFVDRISIYINEGHDYEIVDIDLT